MRQSASLQRLKQWYESRPLRERIMLLACLLVVLFFVWDTLVMSRLSLHKKNAQSEARQLQLELTELGSREQLVQLRKDFDPDRENRQQLAQLQEEIGEIQDRLQENVDNLISPQEMPALLKELLRGQRQLQLLSLENLPAEALQISDQVAEEQIAPALYRHRLRMEFAGDYLATLAYLKQIDRLPRQLVWEKLQIETQEYPRARVLLQVYTLSLNEGWIGG